MKHSIIKILILSCSALFLTTTMAFSDPIALTDAYVATLSDDAILKSNAYDEGNYWLILWQIFADIFLLWVLMKFSLSQKLRDWVKRKTQKSWLQTIIYTPFYLILSFLILLPWSFYTGFWREKAYALSNHTSLSWLTEQMTGLLVSLVAFTLLVTAIYGIIKKAPNSWWAWSTVVTTAALMFMLFIGPVIISPLFNDYVAMEEGPLKERIISMAQANGVPVDNIYMVNASKQSTRISANVQGLGSTARISLNDNLLNNNSDAEIAAVMGHEIGHYALGHSQEMLVNFSLLIGLGFAFVNWGYGFVSRGIGKKWQLNGISDIAGLPLILALFSFYFFITTPVFNSVIRSNETEADIFGLNAAAEPEGFATIALKLSTYRKISPGLWEERIFHDHPSGYNRVLMSMRWKLAMEKMHQSKN